MAGIELAIAFPSTIRNPAIDFLFFCNKGIKRLARIDMAELIIKIDIFHNPINKKA